MPALGWWEQGHLEDEGILGSMGRSKTARVERDYVTDDPAKTKLLKGLG